MKKLLIFIAILAAIVYFISPNLLNTPEVDTTHTEYMAYNATDSDGAVNYDSYLASYDPTDIGTDTVTINGADYIENTDELSYTNGTSLVTSEDGEVTWEFYISDPGLYNIAVDYTTVEGKGNDVIRSIQIDGENPFVESTNIVFNRFWGPDQEPVTTENGDMLQPTQIEYFVTEEVYLQDAERKYDDALQFYLDEGKHTITFSAVQEPIQINTITIGREEAVPTYEEYIAETSENGATDSSGQSIVVQGEDFTYSSSRSLYAESTFVDPSVTPSDPYHALLNMIGGDNWKAPNSFIEWEFTVPEAGYYNITFNYLQNTDNDLKSTRKVYINGEVLFEEMEAVEFVYNSEYSAYTLEQNGEPVKVYLEEGVNTIRMEVTCGALGEILNQLTMANDALNNIYQDTLIITGSTPDPNRDYNLEDSMPNLTSDLEILYNNLIVLKNQLIELSGNEGSNTVIIDKIIFQLEDFIADSDELPNQLGAFKGNIGALPSVISNVKNQELAIDYIEFTSPDVQPQDNSVNVFQKISYSFNRFLASFVYDTNESTSTVEGTGPTIEVWITRGQDELQTWQKLVDNYFTPTTGINVELKLVATNAILPSVLSGNGPDVAMYLPQETPVNYATRNAVYDISQFEDYDEVVQQFAPSAITPFEYNGGVYALPEEQKFPVMFYRKDIFADLGLEVPETWEELYYTLDVLAANNMEMTLEPTVYSNTGILNPNLVFSTILYQHGGTYYINDDMESGLTQPEALDAFEMWCSFYTNYSVDVQADFANRFKTGESPIGIMDYSQYNQITMVAPEIAGKWGIAPVPSLTYNGQTSSAVASTTTGMVMFNDSTEKDAAWEFMKWATSTETQIMYAQEIEARLGKGGRWQSANMEALAASSYPKEDLEVITEAQKNTVGVPQVPGGYMTGRQLDYAFRSVVNDGANPVDAMYEYVVEINKEISLKREEFGLEYIDWSAEENDN